MAAGYSLKMKRKSLEDPNDEFYDFPFFTPATKIRRLDSELTQAVEEKCGIPMNFDQPEPRKQGFGSNNFGGLRIEELPSENEERDIVLFNPMNSLSQFPSTFSLSVDPHIISGLKSVYNDQVRWSSDSRNTDQPPSSNDCLAVVPWVPSTLPSSEQLQNSDLMDSEEPMETTMEVEEVDDTRVDHVYFSEPIAANHFLWRQQQQQHCLISDFSHNMAAAPVSWYG